MSLVNSNEFGQQYIFGFEAADAPTITGFVPRSADLRIEPEVMASGTNQEGHVIALAITTPARRKIMGQFTGYILSTFNSLSLGTTFSFLGRTFFIHNIGDMVKKGDFNEVTIEADGFYNLGSGAINMGDLDYYGSSGFIENLGTLTTDIYGLQTCETTVKFSQNSNINVAPSLFDTHPFFGWLHLEQQKIEIIPGFILVTGRYAGIEGGLSQSVAIYELSIGLGEEPIETHPKFSSDIAGTPSSPLNGAYFIDPSTGELSTDDAYGVFEKFINNTGGGQNPFAGITSYLNMSNVIWRERYVTTSRPSNLSNAGFIDDPHGPVPSINNNLWLNAGTTYEQRGLVYFVTNEWRSFGNQVAVQAPAINIIYTS